MTGKIMLLLSSWACAFAVVMLVYRLIGKQLQQMSTVTRALILSGVLVASMNLVIVPTLTRIIAPRFGPARRD